MVKQTNRYESPDLARLLTGREPGQMRLRLPPNHVLWSQGDLADGVYYIESGQIKVAVVSPHGEEAVIALRGEGEFFGMRALVEPRRRQSVTTLTACSLIRITIATTIRMIREEPDFAELFVRYLVLRASQGDEAVFDQLTYSSEQRLAQALLRLAGFSHDEGAGVIEVPINQAELASMVGTTRSRVSTFMNKFRRLGLIEYSRHGQVKVYDKLSELLRD